MKVIFEKTVAGVARQGEVKEVSQGYARNYLLPNKLAVPATESELAKRRRSAEQRTRAAARVVHNAEQAAANLNGRRFRIQVPASEQGTLFAGVTRASISGILKDNGYPVAADHIVLPEPLKHVGEYRLQVRVHSSVVSTFTLVIEHAS